MLVAAEKNINFKLNYQDLNWNQNAVFKSFSIRCNDLHRPVLDH